MSALDIVHSAALTHRDLTVNNVLVTKTGSVQLSNVSYHMRLLDLHKSHPFGPEVFEETLPEAWRAPEAISAPHTYTRKRDIWMAGVLFLQMTMGLDIVDRSAVRVAADDLPPKDREMINAMLEHSYKKRPTVADILRRLNVSASHLDIKGSSSNALITIPRVAHFGTTPPKGPQGETGVPLGAFWQYSSGPPTEQSKSRYRSEWLEAELLGRGGFGSVVRAQNLMDGLSYAIKKVKLRAQDEKALREITALSR